MYGRRTIAKAKRRLEERTREEEERKSMQE